MLAEWMNSKIGCVLHPLDPNLKKELDSRNEKDYEKFSKINENQNEEWPIGEHVELPQTSDIFDLKGLHKFLDEELDVFLIVSFFKPILIFKN